MCIFQNGMIDTEEADGILYTENMVFANATLNVEYPIVLKSKYVRAAHIYNIAFGHVRQNFSMAGLLLLIQVKINLKIEITLHIEQKKQDLDSN